MSLCDGDVEAAGITGYDFVEAWTEHFGDIAGSGADVVGEGPVIAVAAVIVPDAVVERRGVDGPVGCVLCPVEIRSAVEET